MVSIRKGLAAAQHAAAARLYWEAFGGKLGTVLGPDDRALAYLARVIRADHCFTAVTEDGALLGIAGFKSPFGSFAGGSMADLQAAYGRIGALWRGLALRALGNEVDNQRFLIDGIAVARSARSQGIGSALMAALFDEARARGYGAIRLEVIDSNWRARALYERLGFVATDRVRLGLLQPIFGFAAAITMVRPL
ncbi:GNAT family N-acetyltransferase [Rhodobacter sp. Har01]|uniref:GNAT family N-acetyltransferase n=1 Tax=Rhodobacter sp. Har01 TaxID=2883999 RepID=UPI001D07AF75|nr:GNAT family N-acetyltransferase [Rhodobacter sp. Har01]MCB6177761.1 GNAT family N-acetyltransferase [Rhodobacter sp. Har01]